MKQILKVIQNNKEAYSNFAINRPDKELNQMMEGLKTKVSELLNKLQVSKNKVSVYDVMRELKVSDEERELITKYLRDRGIFDEKSI